MKINVGQALKEMDGSQLELPVNPRDPESELKVLLLKDLIIRGLGKPELTLDPKEHVERFVLAAKIMEAEDVVELKSDEIVKIKKLISEIGYSSLVVGQAILIIEPPAKEEPKKEEEKK